MVVHALVREDGTVDGGELYEVAGLLGMTDQQVRLCVKRLVAEGRFAVEGRGRRSVLRPAGAEPAAGVPALVPEVGFVRHAYRQDRGLEPWDGVWHAFAFAVPESARASRDALRDALTGLGAAPVQGGLYVTPNAIGPYVRARAAELGLSEAVSSLSTRDLAVGGTTDPRALAERLWPLPEIAARYEALRALAGGSAPAGAADGADATDGRRADGGAAYEPRGTDRTGAADEARAAGRPADQAAGGGLQAAVGPPAARGRTSGVGRGTGGTAADGGTLADGGAAADGEAVAGLAQAVQLAVAFSAAMLPDPLLPPELLPQPWPGTTARSAAAGAWARLASAAPPGGPRLFRLYGEALA
ncbi:PaaX family transcriptional regulator C-terminal domain-containing protein [Streptomyces sp. NPDC054849]